MNYKALQNKENFKEKIELLSRNYINSKRVLNEVEEDVINVSEDRIEVHRKIVAHINYVTEAMEERERLIIENEVLKGKRGKWYKEMMSESTYYRLRHSAYYNFLRSL